jgi:hypothetical protein
MKRMIAATTVLLLHTAVHATAAWAQQGPDAPYGPFPSGPGATPPAPAQPANPAPATPPTNAAPTPAVPSPPPTASGAEPAPPSSDDGYPPGYGPPPGYVPPAPPRTYYGPPGGNQGGYGGGNQGGYGGGYGPPPSYGGQPQGYYHYHHLLAPPPPRRVTDRPFTIGGGIGFGGLALNESGGDTWKHNGLSYTARLGIGLRPGLLLLWDIEGSTIDRSIVEGAVARVHSFSQTAQLAALQIFVGDRFFLKGGFGMAQFSRDDALYTDWGGAVMGGLGLELVQGWNWSLDVESTLTAASYQNETLYNWSIANLAINLF